MAPPMMGGGNRNAMRGRPPAKPKDIAKAIRRLLMYIKGDTWRVVLALICVLTSSFTTLVGSYLLRPLINNCVSTADTAYRIKTLALGLGLMAIIYLIGVVCTYIQSRLMIRVSQTALSSIREELFKKMQTLPIRYFDTNATGDLMSRYTNDVDIIGEMLNSTILQIISGIINIVGTFALMLFINPWLTILTVLFIPIYTKTVALITKSSRKYFKQQQEALGKINAAIEENVTGAKVIKVFSHEEKVKAEFDALNRDFRDKQIKAQFSAGRMGPIMGNIGQMNYTLTGAVGAVLCVMGKLDIGGLTVFVNYSRHFSRPINEISMQFTTIMSALAGAERVFAVLDEQVEEPDKPNAIDLGISKGEVEVKNVTFGYNPDKVILHDISFYAHPGQKIAFVGSTGAGKTTIINLLTRFYDVDKGEVLIDGYNIKDIKRESLHNNIAMVLQDTHLFTGTIRDNIRYGRLDATDEEIVAAAKLAGADRYIKHLKYGYDTMLEGDGANISQGQRQLLNIARATLSRAPILILDEATSSVDTRTEQEINRGMESLMENRTTFVIAHRLSTVRDCDAIMVMEQGRIIERGTHEQLLAQKGRYYELYTGSVELD